MVVLVDPVTNSWLAANKPQLTCQHGQQLLLCLLSGPAGSDGFIHTPRFGVTDGVTACHLLIELAVNLTITVDLMCHICFVGVVCMFCPVICFATFGMNTTLFIRLQDVEIRTKQQSQLI